MNLKNRMREAYKAFCNPREAMCNREFRANTERACMTSAIRSSLDLESHESTVNGYSYITYSRLEVVDEIAKRQREAGV